MQECQGLGQRLYCCCFVLSVYFFFFRCLILGSLLFSLSPPLTPSCHTFSLCVSFHSLLYTARDSTQKKAEREGSERVRGRGGQRGEGVYGNVAEIYHSGLTVQFLLSKFRKAWR